MVLVFIRVTSPEDISWFPLICVRISPGIALALQKTTNLLREVFILLLFFSRDFMFPSICVKRSPKVVLDLLPMV